MEDVKALRKLAAEREFYKASFEEAKRQSDQWQKSAEQWKNLYNSEKDRADRVQGGRITELELAINAYKQQADNDRQRLGELEFKLRKSKAQRKYWFFAGAAAGGLAGYKLGSINF